MATIKEPRLYINTDIFCKICDLVSNLLSLLYNKSIVYPYKITKYIESDGTKYKY